MRKAKVIVVSGTPATGKTSLAKKISEELGYEYLDVNKVIKGNKLCEDYDKARHCNVVDVEKLNKVLIMLIESSEKDLVIDSHMAQFLPKDYVDLVIITKCKLNELKKRLHERKYPSTKVRENLDSEIFDICLSEAKEQNHTILEIKTDEEIEMKKIKEKLSSL